MEISTMAITDVVRLDRIYGAIQRHEVGADPTSPASWSGKQVGLGTFLCDNGGLSMDQADSGNWTGGLIGKGVLGGTRWGFSSAAYADDLGYLPAELRATYPAMVKDLTLDQGKQLFHYAYMLRLRAYEMPAGLALLVADSGFNNGVKGGSRWLQEIVGVNEDGAIGDTTLKSVRTHIAVAGEDEIAASFHALRINAMARMTSWSVDGGGWSKRLALLPFQATALAALDRAAV
jgi:lysozyme family protein